MLPHYSHTSHEPLNHPQQASITGPLVARLKRWQRLLAKGKGVNGGWQELLRRYLLLSRAGIPVTPADLENREYGTMSDDLAAVHVSS